MVSWRLSAHRFNHGLKFVVWRLPSDPSVCLGEVAGHQRHRVTCICCPGFHHWRDSANDA
jgi:hypothetical protein